MDLVNQTRAYRFLFGVLTSQQVDPYCMQCSAWNNTLNNTRDALAKFEVEQAAAITALTSEMRRMLADTRDGLAGLKGPSAPVGQKKAGNCHLPEGVCFIKASLALLPRV